MSVSASASRLSARRYGTHHIIVVDSAPNNRDSSTLHSGAPQFLRADHTYQGSSEQDEVQGGFTHSTLITVGA